MPPESTTATSSALCHEPVVSLCDRCRDVPIHPEQNFDLDTNYFDDVRISISEDEIFRARGQGCPICVLIWNSIAPMPRKNRQRDGHALNLVFATLYQLDVYPVEKEKEGPLPRSIVEEMILSFDFDPIKNPYRHQITFGLQPDACNSGIMNYRHRLVGNRVSGKWFMCPVHVNLAFPPQHSGAQSRLTLIEAWLKDCFENHQQCGPGKWHFHPGSGPRRLIDVTSPTHPRLVTQNTDNCNKRYATLSHRWKDAIELCRALRIDYLEIDPLCLIQHEADCKGEIERMGAIYSNAYCNFSTTSAAGLPVGLFAERNTTPYNAFPVTI